MVAVQLNRQYDQSRVQSRRSVRMDEASRRRRRATSFGVAVLAGGAWLAFQATGGGTGGGLLTSAGTSAFKPAAAHVWIVQPGDTLWGIAMASGAKGDIRPVVDRLEEETGGQPLVVGERILLP